MDHRGEGLFDSFMPGTGNPRSFWSFLRGIPEALGKNGDRFVLFVALSLLIHLAAVGTIFLSNRATADGALRVERVHREAFLMALAAMDEDALFGNFSERDREELYSRMPRVGSDASPEAAGAFYKKLIRALADWKSAAGGKTTIPDVPLSVVDASSPARMGPDDSLLLSTATAGGGIEVHRLGKKDAEALDELRRKEADTRPNDRAPIGVPNGRVQVRTDSGIEEVPEEIYFRDCPYEEMTASGASLFWIVKGFPIAGPDRGSFGGVDEPESVSDVSIVPAEKLNVFLVTHRRDAPIAEMQAEKPAALDHPNLETADLGPILDELMAFPERQQFALFEERFLRKYDADDPGLVRLTGEFLNNNLNSIFVIVDDFVSAFDCLEEIYYKKPVYESFAAYGKEHAGTKAGAEFLFALAAAVEFEKRALDYLFNAYDPAEKILSGSISEAGTFGGRTKAFVLKRVYEDLAKRLEEKGFVSREAALAAYDEEIRAVYGLIRDMGGETGNRAAYLLGRHFWDRGDAPAAISAWKSIDPAYSGETFRKIRPFLGEDTDPNVRSLRIRAIFAGSDPDLSRSHLERLLKFHKWRNRAPRG